MKKRKKKNLDGIDREILRALYREGALVSSAIAKRVGLTASAITPRLVHLKDLGILRHGKVLGLRTFRRKFNNKSVLIKAPRSIFWEIDLVAS